MIKLMIRYCYLLIVLIVVSSNMLAMYREREAILAWVSAVELEPDEVRRAVVSPTFRKSMIVSPTPRDCAGIIALRNIEAEELGELEKAHRSTDEDYASIGEDLARGYAQLQGDSKQQFAEERRRQRSGPNEQDGCKCCAVM